MGSSWVLKLRKYLYFLKNIKLFAFISVKHCALKNIPINKYCLLKILGKNDILVAYLYFKFYFNPPYFNVSYWSSIMQVHTTLVLSPSKLLVILTKLTHNHCNSDMTYILGR